MRGCFWTNVELKNHTEQFLFHVVHRSTSLTGLDGIKATELRIQGTTLQCPQLSVALSSYIAESPATLDHK